ncbi:MAG: type II toxin-antitoxin system PemK/MazF family toxin [Verrucomicrobia bacterium]|nr:type II toxin-antitoxin system PemK/MazF family toxin [Verrucomicrobiota bacterium]
MPKPNPRVGEVWLVDGGYVAKTRPCVIITGRPSEKDLDVFTVVFHTTKLRGNRWQLTIPKPFLSDGAFDVQEVFTTSPWRLERKLGELTSTEFRALLDRLAERFGI